MWDSIRVITEDLLWEHGVETRIKSVLENLPNSSILYSYDGCNRSRNSSPDSSVMSVTAITAIGLKKNWKSTSGYETFILWMILEAMWKFSLELLVKLWFHFNKDVQTWSGLYLELNKQIKWVTQKQLGNSQHNETWKFYYVNNIHQVPKW